MTVRTTWWWNSFRCIVLSMTNFSRHYADKNSLKRFLPQYTSHVLSFSFARRCLWVSDASFSFWYSWTGAAGSASRWSHRPLWSTRGAGGGSDWACSEARWSPAGTEKVEVPTRQPEATRLQMQKTEYWATSGNYLCQTGTDQSHTPTQVLFRAIILYFY